MKPWEKIGLWLYALVLLTIILVGGARIFGIIGGNSISPTLAWTPVILSTVLGLLAWVVLPVILLYNNPFPSITPTADFSFTH